MVRYCCVHSCGRNSKSYKNLSFHLIPKDRQEEWLKLGGRQDILERGTKIGDYFFCSRHFEASDFIFKCPSLKLNVTPSLFLPQEQRKVRKPLTKYYEEAANESNHATHAAHANVVCNSCGQSIKGYRYTCLTCEDYDLCQGCERRQEHWEHFMLRISKHLEFVSLDKLIEEWRELLSKHMEPATTGDVSDSSDDDVPINQYKNSGIDLTEDIKETIRKEVKRVLNLKPEELEKKSKKMANSKKKRERKRAIVNENSKIKSIEVENMKTDTTISNKQMKLEVEREKDVNVENVASTSTEGDLNTAFADKTNVDLKPKKLNYLNFITATSQGTVTIPIGQLVTQSPNLGQLVTQPVQDVTQVITKSDTEVAVLVATSSFPEVAVLPNVTASNPEVAVLPEARNYPDGAVLSVSDQRPVMHIKLSDDLTELMVEVTSNNQKNFYKV